MNSYLFDWLGRKGSDASEELLEATRLGTAEAGLCTQAGQLQGLYSPLSGTLPPLEGKQQ